MEMATNMPVDIGSTQIEPHAPSLTSRAPTTTAQQDLTTAGQRKVNLIWEYTQAVVAGGVVFANMIVGVYQGIHQVSVGMPSPQFPIVLSSSLFLVIGFYFSRTNHAAIGGIGPQPTSPYVGR